MDETALELVVEASSDRYEPSDPRWLDQVAGLQADLHAEAGDVSKDVTPVEGRKGGIEAVILALGSAGAFSAAVQIFRTWVKRDKGRTVTVKWKDGETEKAFSVTGENVGSETFESTLREFMEVAKDRLGGG